MKILISQLPVTCRQVNASDAAHVGDHIVEDYWAARNVGMHAFLLDRTGDVVQRAAAAKVIVPPSCVINGLDELTKVLDSDYLSTPG